YSSERLPVGLTDGLTDLTEGAGYLNIAAALEIARKIDPTAATGTPWLDVPLSGTTLLSGEEIPWTQRILWGNAALIGDVIGTRQLAWSENVAWGDDSMWLSNVAWGENAVTSDPSWNSTAAWLGGPDWSDTARGNDILIRGG